VVTEVRPAADLTPKGQRTRARIIDAAAQLIHDRGVVGTTLDDVKAAAGVSSSQLSHYFTGKDGLVTAVIDRHADAVVETMERADLGTLDGLQAWRDLVIAHARGVEGRGGCPLGSLGSQIAEADPHARSHVAIGFTRWSSALLEAMRTLHADGHLAPDVEPADLATTLLAVLQGGLLLSQMQRDTGPLETALDTFLGLVRPK
jgi:TetR/AcrR family transcriptional repressor of nem operon